MTSMLNTGEIPLGSSSLYEGGMCTLHLQQLLNLLVEASQAAALGLSCG